MKKSRQIIKKKVETSSGGWQVEGVDDIQLGRVPRRDRRWVADET